MVESKEVKSEKPEQVIKEEVEEKIKKEKLIEEPVKSNKSYFNYKKISVFLIIGLLLIVGIYYIYDKLQASTPEEQQTETTKEEPKAEVSSSEGKVIQEGKEKGLGEEPPEGAGGEEEGGEEGQSEEEKEREEEPLEGEKGQSEEGKEGEEELLGEEEWSYEPGPNDYLFEKVGSEMIIESVRIRLNSVKSATPKNFVVLEVGDAFREKLELGETRIIEGLSITLLEAHPEETLLESYALLRVEKP